MEISKEIYAKIIAENEKLKKKLERLEEENNLDKKMARKGSLENVHKDKLTAIREETFINAYIATNDMVSSARRAGIADETLSDKQAKAKIERYLKKRPELEERMYKEVERLAQEELDKAIMSRDETLALLTSIARNEETEEMVMAVGCGKGVQTVEKVNKDMNGMTRLKAAELMGKYHGCFTDKLQIDGKLPVVIEDDM